MTVCLTGASGFLGSRLLPPLLRQHTGPVVALMRDEPGRALDRLARAVDAAGGDADEVRARVRAVRADVARPRLGLSDRAYRSLADEVTAVWHCAASVDLGARLADLLPVNVDGTERILDLVEAGRHAPRLVHVSTAFVAGLRRGRVGEDDLDGSAGFAVPYEESKFRAEVLVRDWSRRTGRDAVVLRPSVLATDRAIAPGTAGHTLSGLAATIGRVFGRGVPGVRTPVRRLRLAVPADATLNLLQVDHAVEAMPAVARSGRTGTFHVTHPVDTPIRLVMDVVEERLPGVRIELGAPSGSQGLVDRFVGRAFGAFLTGRMAGRRYDRARLLAAVPDLADPAPIGRDYLRAAMWAPVTAYASENRSLSARQHV
jgi:dihydroflavonol-4-reductase